MLSRFTLPSFSLLLLLLVINSSSVLGTPGIFSRIFGKKDKTDDRSTRFYDSLRQMTRHVAHDMCIVCYQSTLGFRDDYSNHKNSEGNEDQSWSNKANETNLLEKRLIRMKTILLRGLLLTRRTKKLKMIWMNGLVVSKAVSEIKELMIR